MMKTQGSILIVVLWASFGLVAITLLFGHSMIMTYRGTDNDLAGRQAEQAIDGAVRYVQTLFAAETTPGLMLDPLTMTSEAAPVGEAKFYLLGRAEDDVNGTTREYGLVDEASKLNVNMATQPMLLALPGMTDDLAAAIIEWRTTSTGGTADTTVKHAPFESVEELALVAGMTREILYGEDTNLNGVLDPNEDDSDKSLPADNSDGKLDPGLLEYLTVFSSEPDKDSAGTALFNLDPAAQPPPTLAGLQAALTTAELSDVPTAMGNLGSTMPTSVLDLVLRGSLSAEDEIKAVAAVRNPSVLGLVNVNTASETVLAALPGIGAKAADIVAARLSRTSPSASLLWLKDVLTPQEITNGGPFLTGRSFQATADVAAVGRQGRGYRRAKVVIDRNPFPPPSVPPPATPSTTAITTPRIIYRRNLAPLGWALGREVRSELALQREVR